MSGCRAEKARCLVTQVVLTYSIENPCPYSQGLPLLNRHPDLQGEFADPVQPVCLWHGLQ